MLVIMVNHALQVILNSEFAPLNLQIAYLIHFPLIYNINNEDAT